MLFLGITHLDSYDPMYNEYKIISKICRDIIHHAGVHVVVTMRFLIYEAGRSVHIPDNYPLTSQ